MDRKKLIAALAGEPYAAFGTGSPAEEMQKPSGLAALFGMFGGGHQESTAPPQVQYKTAHPLTDITDQDINRGMNAAMAVSGGGMTTKGVPGIRAYHGSPHDFDRFDLSKIGTGEGAQAYGHGLYFAENEGVARGYRDVLSGDYFRTPKGRLFDPQQELEHLNVRSRAHSNGSNLDATIELAQKMAASDAPSAVMAQRDLKKLMALKAEGGVTRHNGKMYEVNIKADPAHFLDWDKPFGQQSGAVREAFSPQRLGLKEAGPLGDRGWLGWVDSKDRLIGRAQTGARPTQIFDDREMASGAYRGGGTWKPDEAASILKEAGIPGIKYLDQGSRGAGQGSSNYVVFDDKLIDIMRKYGLAALPAAGAVGAAASEPRGLAAVNTY